MHSLILLVFHWFLREVFQLMLPFAIVEVTAQPLPAHQVVGSNMRNSWNSHVYLGELKGAKLDIWMKFQGNFPYKHHISLHLFASPSPHLSQPWASPDLSDAADSTRLSTWKKKSAVFQTIRKAWHFSAEIEKSLRHQAWSLDYLSANMDVSQKIWPLAKYVDLNKKCWLTYLSSILELVFPPTSKFSGAFSLSHGLF